MILFIIYSSLLKMTFREQFGKAEETSESLEVDFFFVN